MHTFLCALPQEARFLRAVPLIREGKARLVCCGVGLRNAGRVTRELLSESRPSLVISTGVAGALSPTLRVGDLVVAKEVVDESTGNRFSCARHSTLDTQPLALLSVSRMITSAEEKTCLAQKFTAVAVDMESAAIAQVCAEHGIPFAVVRAVSDTAQEVLPEAITRFFDANGGLRPMCIASELIKKPSLLKDLKRLRSQTNVAGAALKKYLETVSG